MMDKSNYRMETAMRQCDGSCHNRRPDVGDCVLCGSLDSQRMCDDCTFYAMQYA